MMDGMGQVQRVSREPTSFSRTATTWALFGTICFSLACVVPIAYYRDGLGGIRHAIMACVACWITSLLVLELQRWCPRAEAAYGLALLGILVRMLLPLSLCGTSILFVGIAATQTLAVCFVVVYPIFLTVDTYLIVQIIEASADHSGRPHAVWDR